MARTRWMCPACGYIVETIGTATHVMHRCKPAIPRTLNALVHVPPDHDNDTNGAT